MKATAELDKTLENEKDNCQAATICFKMATQPKHDPPQGMEPYDLGGPGDLGALSPEQQEKINKFKVETRIENEKYLRQHPEVECLIAGFLGEILKKRPENIREYAARHFTNRNLPQTVMQQLEDRQEKIKQHKVLTKV